MRCHALPICASWTSDDEPPYERFAGEDADKWGPASMYTVCDVQDGDYILVDVSRREAGRYPIIDGYHEAFPDPAYCPQISASFSEFLDGALRSEGRHFYLRTGQE